jgi:hypothetical protein
MLKDFQKGEGERCNDILSIIAKGYSKDIIHSLTVVGAHNPELDKANDGAYLLIGDKTYVNTTYTYSTTSLKTLKEGYQIFKESLLDSRDIYKNFVSFRQLPMIKEDDQGNLYFHVRLTFVPKNS